MKKQSSIFQTMFVGAVFAVLFLPLLFQIYRMNGFDTIPRDAYEKILLHVVGDDEGHMMGSPFDYRILSVIPAVIPYMLVEAPQLTHLTTDSESTLNAIFALATVSYLSIVGLSAILFHYLRKTEGIEDITALAAALAVPMLHFYAAPYMTDPFVILYLFVCFLAYKQPFLWAVLLLVGVGVNEKIPLIFALYTSSTLLYKRDRPAISRFLVAFAACLIYVVIRKILNFPGHENQVDITTFWEGFSHSLGLSLSIKGMMRNVIPVVVLCLIALPLFSKNATDRWKEYEIHPVHFLMIIGLTFVSLVTNVKYNVGRNVMHLFPIYLPIFFIWIQKRRSFSLKT